MRQVEKSGGFEIAAPGGQVVEAGVSARGPAFFVVAVRVGAEQHATLLETGAQLAEHARKLLAGNVEQRRVGEDPVIALPLQRQSQKVLVQHAATGVRLRHLAKTRASVEAHRLVTERSEVMQIPPRPAAEVEQRERRRRVDVREKRRMVLTGVMVLRALPEIFGGALVVVERGGGYLLQLVGSPLHLPSLTGLESARAQRSLERAIGGGLVVAEALNACVPKRARRPHLGAHALGHLADNAAQIDLAQEHRHHDVDDERELAVEEQSELQVGRATRTMRSSLGQPVRHDEVVDRARRLAADPSRDLAVGAGAAVPLIATLEDDALAATCDYAIVEGGEGPGRVLGEGDQLAAADGGGMYHFERA